MPHRLLSRAASRATGRIGWLRGALGALVAIVLAGWITRLAIGAESGALPWLVAPLGASAVLVFVLPASPLAQPWPVFGGDLLSALVGVGMGLIVPEPALAAGLALASAIAVMSLLRCLHPPGGACALLGVLSAHAGWDQVILALACNLAVMLAVAWAWNNLTGHAWPHRLVAPAQPQLPGALRTYEAADLDAVLEEWDEVLDVSRDDLDALFRAVERRVQRRQDTGGSTSGTR
ncbi:MAG: hypothetical protein RIQ46_1258 [Pseudomonadota bacterium]|jgi:CBS domain-containing membrane protein